MELRHFENADTFKNSRFNGFFGTNLVKNNKATLCLGTKIAHKEIPRSIIHPFIVNS